MTSPTTTPQVPRRLSGPVPGQRRLRDVLRGVAALVALAGLILGVPVALLTVAPLHLSAQIPTCRRGAPLPRLARAPGSYDQGRCGWRGRV